MEYSPCHKNTSLRSSFAAVLDFLRISLTQHELV